MSYGVQFVVGFLEEKLGKRVAKQILYIILMVFGIERKRIKAVLGASDVTLVKYGAALKDEDLERIFSQNYNRPQSELEAYRTQIEEAFEIKPPATRREAALVIERITGIKRGLTQVGKFLKKGGLKSRAVGFMPSKANPENQSAFLSDTLKPAIQQAKSGLIQLFFMDASHFVMGGLPARLWGKVRHWVKTGSGRKRFNVLGALNFVSKKIETVTNDSYITSAQVVELLINITAKYAGVPIAIVLDNARYQACNFVKDKAAELGIQLIFLPTYSPNLNLIERVWKFVKAEVLNAVYIESFEDYRTRISRFVDTIDTVFADRMASLVTENFQMFDKCKVL